MFGKIAAAVTDIGGMMSHAAIVCREYGLPAVTGTGNASAKIKTGHAAAGGWQHRHRDDPRLTPQGGASCAPFPQNRTATP